MTSDIPSETERKTASFSAYGTLVTIITEVAERLELDGMHYGADTSGCPIKCFPDLIRKRAYQLFEARGRRQGHELDDWLQAEREIKHHLRL
jgi:hypothetical protein